MLPYFVLGLYRARPLVWSSMTKSGLSASEDEGALYFRLSDRYYKDMSSPRYMDRIPDPRSFVYIGSPDVMDGLCRVLFVTRSKDSIDAQYHPLRMEKTMPDGSRKVEEHSFSDFLSKLGYEASDMAKFTNVVFKICDGGVFGLAPDAVKDVFRHDFPKGQTETLETVPRYGRLVSFTKREISEVAFWVFAKRNRKSSYSHLAERHPELFLPLSGFADFETVIGKRLVNWTPIAEEPPKPGPVPHPLSPPPPPKEVRRIVPYKNDAAISADLRRYKLKTGVFVCSGANGSNEVPFLVYGPRRGVKSVGPLPMLERIQLSDNGGFETRVGETWRRHRHESPVHDRAFVRRLHGLRHADVLSRRVRGVRARRRIRAARDDHESCRGVEDRERRQGASRRLLLEPCGSRSSQGR